jgi:DNA-directed RNA polymerase specialized sigma24 family protein
VDRDEERRATELLAVRQEGALSALIEEYQQPVGAYLLHLVGDFALALRLTEETFMCAYRACAATRSGLPGRPWLYRRATSLALRHPELQRRLPRVTRPAAGRGLDGTVTERTLVQSALLDLPASERAVLLLCDFEQLPRDEVAGIMAMSADRLDQRLRRARARFRLSYVKHHARPQSDSR